jgi:eukaryotic-like serine/threonine-protein kinase
MNEQLATPVEADHPSAADLVAFGQGRMDAAIHAAIESHVAHCETCCQALQTVPDDTLAVALRGIGGRDETLAVDPVAAAPNDLTLPKELIDHPRYRVIRPLGKGGMGVVYQAEHRLMDRPVALKVINRRLTSSPTAVERFRFEVKAAARLSHPSIVTAHDAEQAGDLHFLVMEYVDGVSLARQVEKRGPLSVLHACNFVRQAAQGLQHAFERGMVHRDIKPQNLMLTRKAQIKILDFGLARLAHDNTDRATGEASTAAGAAAGLTMDGVVLGTPDYIAPEQVSDSRAVDIRADIYSLGCTLYYLLTGRVPFPGGTAAQKVAAHVSRNPPPIGSLRANLPAGLVAIIERMMAKDPSHRFQTPAEVAAALLPFSRPSGSGSAVVEAPAPLSAAVAVEHPVDGPPAGLQALEAAAQAAADPLSGHSPWMSRQQLLTGLPADAKSIGDASYLTARSRRRGWSLWARENRRWLIPATAAPVVLLVGWLAVSICISAFGKAKETFANLSSTGSASQVVADGAAISAAEARHSTSPAESAPVPMAGEPVYRAPGKQVLLVIAHKGFWYADYEPVRRVLEQGGAVVTVASSEAGLAIPDPRSSGKSATQPVQADIALVNARPEDYDAIVFTGGGMDEFMWNGVAGEAMRNLVKPMIKQRKWVTSLCAGNKVLAAAGVLKGHEAALNPYIPEGMKSVSVANWLWDRPVVVSDRVITASSFEHAEQFAQELLHQMSAR